MRFATLRVGGMTRVAVVEDGVPVRLLAAVAADVAALAADPGLASRDSDDPVPADAALLAPIPRPRRNLFCVGKNYHEHAAEFARSGFDSGAAVTEQDCPIIFSKVPESVIADGATIMFDPAVSASIDYEGELAVIIGQGGRGISQARAMEHVWGYTVVNDVTARAGPHEAVACRQIVRHVLPHGALGRYRRRGRLGRHSSAHLGEWRASTGRKHLRPDF